MNINCHQINIEPTEEERQIQLLYYTDLLDRFVIFCFNHCKKDEEWREIAGFDGRYFISNIGRALSLCRGKATLLNGSIDDNGYRYISPYKDGKKVNLRIHYLVAAAFLQRPKGKDVVHHKDANKLNNNCSNLEWLTHQEHAEKHKQMRELQKKKEIINAE